VDGIQLLIDDHRQVQKLLKELGKTDEKDPRPREQLFDQVRDAMAVHELIEEEVFYPALRKHEKAKDLVLESYVEHDVVDRFMGELEKTSFTDEMWGAKCQVMSEEIEHHIGDEENELFPKARQIFDENELDELGDEMQRRKTEGERDPQAARQMLSKTGPESRIAHSGGPDLDASGG